MTISTETRIAGPYTGDGTTVIFPFAFKVFAKTDLLVTVAGAERTVDTHYVVAFNEDQDTSPGGSVAFTSAPASGAEVYIRSAIPMTQAVKLVNGGGWYPAVVNKAFDKLTALIQQVATNGSAALVEAATAAAAAATAAVSTVGAAVTAAAGSATAAAGSATAAAGSATAAAASAAAIRFGYVRGVKVADNAFLFYTPTNALIDTTGTTTGGLQEALNYAALHGYNFRIDGGGIEGTAYPSYDKSTIDCGSTTLHIPNFQLRTVEFGAITLNFSGAIGTNPGVLFDSGMMFNFRFDGQVVYAGNGHAVQVTPTNAVPGGGITTLVDSSCYIQTIAYIGGGSSSNASCFAITGGSLTQRVKFRFTEVNGANGSTIYAKYGIYIENNCAENCTFEVGGGIHHVSKAGIQNGSSTADTSRSGNTFRAGGIQVIGSTADAVNNFQPCCQFEFGAAGVGTYRYAAFNQSSASDCIFLIRQASGGTGMVNDQSSGTSVIGAGLFRRGA